MRAPTIAILIVGLALWCGQTLAQPLQPRYSADGLYNLANSYARAGKPGLAVLNYERASLLAPDDADINANLEYVRASAHVPTEPRTRFARIAQAAKPALAAWIGVLGIALVGMGLLAGRLAPRFKWLRAGGILLGVTLIALTVSNAMLLWPRMHEAVVLIKQTPARVSPVPMGDTAFVLREAETVTMTAEHEDFILIRTRGGLSGWVARADLGTVVPQAGVYPLPPKRLPQ
jgi:type IV secretory pathway VirB2 component (pilin)